MCVCVRVFLVQSTSQCHPCAGVSCRCDTSLLHVTVSDTVSQVPAALLGAMSCNIVCPCGNNDEMETRKVDLNLKP